MADSHSNGSIEVAEFNEQVIIQKVNMDDLIVNLSQEELIYLLGLMKANRSPGLRRPVLPNVGMGSGYGDAGYRTRPDRERVIIPKPESGMELAPVILSLVGLVFIRFSPLFWRTERM